MKFIYEIKIEGGKEEQGSIDLHRLARLADSICEIAKGALQIRVEGISKKRGDSPIWVKEAVQIRLRDLREGSTVLVLECDQMKATLPQLQGDLFKQDELEDLSEQTPVGLVVASLQEALQSEHDVRYLDKPLLRDLQELKKAFMQEKEVMSFANQGSFPELELRPADFIRIRKLEETTPEPRQMLVSGVVDQLTYSKSQVIILTPDGSVRARLDENLAPEQMGKYWGKQATIAGRAHFRPNGKLAYFEIQQVFEANNQAQAYLALVPQVHTAEEQVSEFLRRNSHRSNRLKDIIGQWPGEEPYEEIVANL
jgi:hypothetical protein